jgi:methionyl-tRNA formyltransferase
MLLRRLQPVRTAIVGAVSSTKILLHSLINGGIKPLRLFTLPRDMHHRHSDFVDLTLDCSEHDVEVSYISDINDPETINELKQLNLDILFVVGWSQICRSNVLNIPSQGCIGYHPALLPLYRGRAVIPWTILLDLSETGGTFFFLDEGVDSGDIIIQESFLVEPNETATTLYKKHEIALGKMSNALVKILTKGKIPRKQQDHSLATYCAKRVANDGLINWQLPAQEIWRLIRAVTDPYPGAFSFWKNEKLIIWNATPVDASRYIGLPGQVQDICDEGVIVQCGDQQHLLLREVQIEGQDRINPKYIFKKHERLGIDVINILKR